MPFAPPHPCTHPGCGALVRDGSRCDKHRAEERKRYDKSRQGDEFRKFYSSRQWIAARDRHKQVEPLCRECRKRGLVAAVEIVDHIIPIRNGGDRLDDSNLQSLCWSCHSTKSITEGSRYGVRK